METETIPRDHCEPTRTAAQRFFLTPEMLLSTFINIDSFTTFQNLRLVCGYSNNLAINNQYHILRSIANNSFPPHIHHLFNARRYPLVSHSIPRTIYPKSFGDPDRFIKRLANAYECKWHNPLLIYHDVDPSPGRFSIAGRELQRLEREDDGMRLLARNLADAMSTYSCGVVPVQIRLTEGLVERIKNALYLLHYIAITQSRMIPKELVSLIKNGDHDQSMNDRIFDSLKAGGEVSRCWDLDFSAAEQLHSQGLTGVLNDLALILITAMRWDNRFRGVSTDDSEVLSCESLSRLGGRIDDNIVYGRASLKLIVCRYLIHWSNPGENVSSGYKLALMKLHSIIFRDLHFDSRESKAQFDDFSASHYGIKPDSRHQCPEGSEYNLWGFLREARPVLWSDGVWRNTEGLWVTKDIVYRVQAWGLREEWRLLNAVNPSI